MRLKCLFLRPCIHKTVLLDRTETVCIDRFALSFVSRYCHFDVDRDVSTAYCWSSSGDGVDWVKSGYIELGVEV